MPINRRLSKFWYTHQMKNYAHYLKNEQGCFFSTIIGRFLRCIVKLERQDEEQSIYSTASRVKRKEEKNIKNEFLCITGYLENTQDFMTVLTWWRDWEGRGQGRRQMFHWGSLYSLRCELYNLLILKKSKNFQAQKFYSVLTTSEEGLDVHTKMFTLFDDGRDQTITQISHGRVAE